MGHELADKPLPKPPGEGKWKVVAPDGTVRAFATQSEMLAALAEQEAAEGAESAPVTYPSPPPPAIVETKALENVVTRISQPPDPTSAGDEAPQSVELDDLLAPSERSIGARTEGQFLKETLPGMAAVDALEVPDPSNAETPFMPPAAETPFMPPAAEALALARGGRVPSPPPPVPHVPPTPPPAKKSLSLVSFEDPPPVPLPTFARQKPIQEFPYEDRPPHSESELSASELVPVEPSDRPPAAGARVSQPDLEDIEQVSLRDLVVVPPAANVPVESTSEDLTSSARLRAAEAVPHAPPPKKGALRTLPPPPRPGREAPPPPTINVASTPPPPESKSTKSSVPATSTPARAVADDRAPAPQRSWLMPGLALLLIAGAALYFSRKNDTTTTTTTPTASPSTSVVPPATGASATAMPSATMTTEPVASTAPPAVSGAPSSSAHGPEVRTSGVGGPLLKLEDAKLNLPEVLQGAASARRAGDTTRARMLYERALALNPGNAEAHYGLGEIARATGDIAGAKRSYEAAIATSPRYTPALLALADTQWDSGDKEAAKQRYREILSIMPSASERVRERAGPPPAPPPPPPPAPEQPEGQ
jgi:hypothetical protein